MAKPILIIVDEEALVKWLPRYFQEQGVSVVQAADDNEALDHARDAPDIVILDLVLANRDSYALIQEIKSVAPGAYLICISARAGTVARRKALAIGADAFLDKPLALAELDRLVNGVTGTVFAAKAGRKSSRRKTNRKKGRRA